jgi:UDPglucose--hexose-1-phosphate uridylyltransferase
MSSTRGTGSTSADLGGGVTRTVRTMADGREITYYDATPGHARDTADRRVLDDAPTHTELRHDPLLDQWVVVAGRVPAVPDTRRPADRDSGAGLRGRRLREPLSLAHDGDPGRAAAG